MEFIYLNSPAFTLLWQDCLSGEFAYLFELQFEPLEDGSSVYCKGKTGAGCALSLFEAGSYAIGLVTAP